MNRPKTRDERSDSTESRSEAFEIIAEGEIQPPGHVQLRAGDLPFWSDIMRTRARQVWTAVDLLHAANLSRTLADIEKIQAGNGLSEGKQAMINSLSQRAMNLSRMLQLTPRSASTNAARDGRKAKEAEEEAVAAAAAAEDAEDLIPTHRLQ